MGTGSTTTPALAPPGGTVLSSTWNPGRPAGVSSRSEPWVRWRLTFGRIAAWSPASSGSVRSSGRETSRTAASRRRVAIEARVRPHSSWDRKPLLSPA